MLKLDKLLEGFTLEAKFIPFSKSRNKDNKNPSLNWIVTVLKDSKPIITTDYSQGCGHCSAYKADHRDKEGILEECETGKTVRKIKPLDRSVSVKVPPPNIKDVLYSLCIDSEVLDYSSFAEWASSMGFNSDSIADKKIYDACLEIALTLRNALGDKLLSKLKKAFVDY